MLKTLLIIINVKNNCAYYCLLKLLSKSIHTVYIYIYIYICNHNHTDPKLFNSSVPYE